MHVEVRERDTEHPRIGTQYLVKDSHQVSINTSTRTMTITENADGELLVRTTDMLGRPIQPRNESAPAEPAELTDDLPRPALDPDMTAQERMLRAGLQGIISDVLGPGNHSNLLDRLWDYARRYPGTLPDLPASTIGGPWPEWQVRESIRRAIDEVFPGSDAPVRRVTVQEILDNLKHYVQHEESTTKADANEPASPMEARRLKETIQAIVNVHGDDLTTKNRAKLVNGLFHELNQVPRTTPTYDTFGGFWDAMQALRNDGANAVLFMAEGVVYAATMGTAADRATPMWMVTRGNGTHRPLHEYFNAPAYTILATATDSKEPPF